MKINNLFKIFLALTLLFVNLNAVDDGMVDEDLIDTTKKSNIKAKILANYKEDSTLGNDIKYDVKYKKVEEYKIYDVEDEFGYIDIPNLKEGQSGIVVNKNTSPIIIAVASVVESNDKRSKIEFSEFEEFKQDAIPTSNLKPANGDFFILNYLYEASIIIAPNIESFQGLRNQLREFDFLHPDLLASFLKVEEEPIPTKELIQKFALEQNLGSLFVIIKDKAYQLDSKTFKIVKVLDIKYNDTNVMKPFYTRVEEIDQSLFDFGADDIENYTKYYKELLEIK